MRERQKNSPLGEINRFISVSQKFLSSTVYFIEDVGNPLRISGSVYYAEKFSSAGGAIEYLKKYELLCDYSESKQKEIEAAVHSFLKSVLPQVPTYHDPNGYAVYPECYRESNSAVKILFIDDSDAPYIEALVNKNTGDVNFEYCGRYSGFARSISVGSLNIKSILNR